MCPQGKSYQHKKGWALSVTESYCVGGAALNMLVTVRGSMPALYLHLHGNIYITEKSYHRTRQVETGCKIWWAGVKACLYSFIISYPSERLVELLWPHDSYRIHCGGHHLSGVLTGFYLLIPSSYWQNVNFIFISQKPLALGLLFNSSLLYCEVEKNFLL